MPVIFFIIGLGILGHFDDSAKTYVDRTKAPVMTSHSDLCYYSGPCDDR